MHIKEITFEVDIVFYRKFWTLLPAININTSSRELEFEWLCFGIYIGVKND